jgi:HAD superfamily hydrolase (TIGR01509 family)
MPEVRGIIFDLDGTLVDSRLDFDAIRRDMGLPFGIPILEGLAGIPEGPDREQKLAILREHELRGADEAMPFEGVLDFLRHVEEQGILSAVLTRNSRECANRTLDRWKMSFSQVVTREDAPVKPDPGGVLLIAERWELPPEQIVVIGDYLFDLQAGRRAGSRSVLYAPSEYPDFASEADFVLRHFQDGAELLQALIKEE